MKYIYVRTDEIQDKKKIITRKSTRRTELVGRILKMIEEGEDCIQVECEDLKERNRVYQNVYAYTKRRHDIPVRRLCRGLNVYIINEEVDATISHKTI